MQVADPKLSAFLVATQSAPASQDADPSDRSADRLLARLGLLEDAPPLFGSARAVPRAGVLLALPVLIASGVFECAQKIYGSLGPSFYGLRTSLLTLLLMALWRVADRLASVVHLGVNDDASTNNRIAIWPARPNRAQRTTPFR
jgi:hypothetical protein